MKTKTFKSRRAHTLSFVLLLGVAFSTGCKKECDTVCQNGGTVTESCGCNCPAGFGGEFCQTSTTPSCYLSDAGTIWTSPDGLPHVNEAVFELPTGYFMTGVGFSTTSTNLNTLMIKARKLNSDCTIGIQTEFRAGDLPDASLEKQYTVPSGYAITGVGVGVTGSTVTGLRVFYRQLIQQSDGSWRLGSQYTYDNGGAIQCLTSVSQYGSLTPSLNLLTGFGAITQSSTIYQTWASVGKLNP